VCLAPHTHNSSFPQAQLKKLLIKEGKLDKYGRPNENTPSEWKSNYIDYNVPKNEPLPPPVKAASSAPSTPMKVDIPVKEEPKDAKEAPKEEKKGKKRKKDSSAEEEPSSKEKKKKKKKKENEESKDGEATKKEKKKKKKKSKE